MKEYLSNFQPRYVEGTGQALNYAETLRPHPIIGMMMTMHNLGVTYSMFAKHLLGITLVTAHISLSSTYVYKGVLKKSSQPDQENIFLNSDI